MATKRKTTASKQATKKAGAKSATKKPATITGKAALAKKATKPKRTSAIDSGAKVLSESKEPLTTKEMVDAMSAKGYW